MSKITVYEKPTCTTCRKLSKLLQEQGIEFEKVNYYIKPFTKNKINTLLKKMGITAEELLRTRDAAYKELDMKNKKYTKAELVEKMVENHDLIQRPIVELGDKAVLARPVERVNELFG